MSELRKVYAVKVWKNVTREQYPETLALMKIMLESPQEEEVVRRRMAARGFDRRTTTRSIHFLGLREYKNEKGVKMLEDLSNGA